MENKKVVVLGGDGFCGWPTALHLSENGYEVIVVDNLSRRKIDLDLGTNSLTPIKSMELRLKKWEELTGKKIQFHNFDVAENYHRLFSLFVEFKPDAVTAEIHGVVPLGRVHGRPLKIIHARDVGEGGQMQATGGKDDMVRGYCGAIGQSVNKIVRFFL